MNSDEMNERIKAFTSQGVFELLYNYHIEIIVNPNDENVFEVYISRMNYKLLNLDHYNDIHENYRTSNTLI